MALGLMMQTGVPLIAVCAVETVAIWILSKMSSRETIPSTAEWELTITCLTTCLSMVDRVSWTVLCGPTARTGLVIISLSLTLPGFLPCDITLKRMSVLLTMPTTSPTCDTRTLLTSLSFMRFNAWSVNLSPSKMATLLFMKCSIGEDSSAETSSGMKELLIYNIFVQFVLFKDVYTSL